MPEVAPGTLYTRIIPAASPAMTNLAMCLTRRIPELVTIAKHNLVSDFNCHSNSSGTVVIVAQCNGVTGFDNLSVRNSPARYQIWPADQFLSQDFRKHEG